MPQKWEQIVARKRRERDSKIPIDWRIAAIPDDTADVTHLPYSSGILSARELDITGNYTAAEIIEGTIKRKWTSVEVSVAFCKRAAIAQQAVNCLTEIFFDEAISRARALDKYLEEHGRPIGLFHGLPISLKDSFSITGYDSTVGMTARAHLPATENAVLPQMLLDAGTILYVKTTMPQGQQSLDTHSNLWGRTCNPYNRKLTAGGSSGGEAALLAMKGSVLGVGSDAGGSIRIPAACCGLYGIKVGHGKLPRKGTETIEIPGSPYIGMVGTVGPMARTMSDCTFFLDMVQRLQPWKYDPNVLPYGPIRHPDLGRRKRLSIGVMRCDGVAIPHPPVLNMLDEVEKKLKAAGHLVYDISIPGYAKAFGTANGLFSINGSEKYYDLLEAVGEPPSPWLGARIARRGPRSLMDLYGLTKRKEDFETILLEKVWEGEKDKEHLDLIISPAAPHAPTPHDHWGGVSYTSVWNLVDYPAGVIPVRNVKETDLRADIVGDSLGRWDDGNRKLWDHKLRKQYVGAPLAVQVIGRKAQEGQLCAAMEVIDGILNKTGSSAKL